MIRTLASRQSKHLKDYLLCMQEHCVPSEEELALVLSMARSGSVEAQRALVEDCLPLVVAWTAPLRGQEARFSRLIEAGNMALIGALKGTDLDLGKALIPQLKGVVEKALARVLSQQI
jgi:DNA-directed RNA polymerase sigma subunit (sigma70/sigma32)